MLRSKITRSTFVDAKKHGLDNLLFIFSNKEAYDWYYPLKPYTLLEYKWVRDNLVLEGKQVIDAGCHHGNYAIVFKPANVHAVDNNPANLSICRLNMQLNDMKPDLRLATLGAKGAMIPRADIYKVDIEGAEHRLFPSELDRYPMVTCWIVEIHPNDGDPDIIAKMFLEKGFELLKVDRESLTVRPYKIGEKWLSHATLIARKDSK